jgi:outer membrane cobalamin receptor
LGNFKLKPLAAGQYTVIMRLTGFKEVNINNTEVLADKITRLTNTVMNDTVGDLSTIVVIAYKDPLIQVDGGNVVSIRSKELEQMSTSHGGDIKKIALSLTSDIKVSANGEELYFRGSRSGSVIYFIDGVKIRQNVPNVPSSGISSMQVYTGGVPAKYGDTTGGVIVLETKSYLEEYEEKMRKLEALGN